MSPINFPALMNKAILRVIADALKIVEQHGMPEGNHFMITFDTTHSDAKVPGWLRSKYPNQITITLQNWFEDLVVTDSGFSVTLNFQDQPQRLYAPFDSIIAFVDPEAKFGLHFGEDRIEEGTAVKKTDKRLHSISTKPESSERSNVVSLDRFRKT